MSPISEKKRESNKRWNDANMKSRYDRIQLVTLKGVKERIQAAAENADQSVNSYILQAVDERIERDNAMTIRPDPS